MKNLNSVNKNKGVSLIAAIAIMLIVAVLSVVLASMLGVTSRTSLDQLRSAQALALAQAGLNWYMMRLTGISDWTSENNLTDISLGAGTFDITVSNKTSTRVDFTLTGKVTGSDGVTIKRTMSQRAWKLPSASKFSLFWGRRTGSTLTLTATAIAGDFWSQGTTNIPAGSTVAGGSAYRPTTENITGAGTYTEVDVGASPYFSSFSGATSTVSTPQITSTYYTNLITTYTAQLSRPNSGTCNPSGGTITLTGGNDIICQNDFNTNGNLTITGTGFIVAKRDVLLHSENADSGTLTITPVSGPIVFIADDNFTVGPPSPQNDSPVSVSSGTRMFCRSNGNNDTFNIRRPTTSISGALILANRLVIIQDGADVNSSTLFIADNGDTTNNYLRITGSGTTVGALASPSCIIDLGSASGNPSSLTIESSASAAGLFYQYDSSGNTGRTRLNSATIQGIVIADRFQGNAITSSTITYDPGAISDPPPEGFNGFATKKPNTWSGN